MTVTKRNVRPDQHGSVTGYSYGCRCRACMDAQRDYHRNRESAVSDDLLERVFAAIEREADMDGLTIVGENRLAELAGCAGRTANAATRALERQGRIAIDGRHEGRGGAFKIQVIES